MGKKDNSRMEAVENWAKQVRILDNREWSRQQAVLIDSQIINARKINLSREQVEHIQKKTRK
jgi:hypothetical protein